MDTLGKVLQSGSGETGRRHSAAVVSGGELNSSLSSWAINQKKRNAHGSSGLLSTSSIYALFEPAKISGHEDGAIDAELLVVPSLSPPTSSRQSWQGIERGVGNKSRSRSGGGSSKKNGTKRKPSIASTLLNLISAPSSTLQTSVTRRTPSHRPRNFKQHSFEDQTQFRSNAAISESGLLRQQQYGQQQQHSYGGESELIVVGQNSSGPQQREYCIVRRKNPDERVAMQRSLSPKRTENKQRRTPKSMVVKF